MFEAVDMSMHICVLGESGLQVSDWVVSCWQVCQYALVSGNQSANMALGCQNFEILWERVQTNAQLSNYRHALLKYTMKEFFKVQLQPGESQFLASKGLTYEEKKTIAQGVWVWSFFVAFLSWFWYVWGTSLVLFMWTVWSLSLEFSFDGVHSLITLDAIFIDWFPIAFPLIKKIVQSRAPQGVDSPLGSNGLGMHSMKITDKRKLTWEFY